MQILKIKLKFKTKAMLLTKKNLQIVHNTKKLNHKNK